MFSLCEPWSVAMIYRTFGVTNDGSVYMWEKRTGEWDSFALILYPVAGAIGFFFIGIFVVLVIWFNSFLDNLRQKALDK